jgi:hypothetical protein
VKAISSECVIVSGYRIKKMEVKMSSVLAYVDQQVNQF